MAKRPWESWLPGVLGVNQVKSLAKEGYLLDAKGDYDHSSIDLRLSDEVYELKNGAIKPAGGPYRHLIKPFSSLVKPENNTKPRTFILSRRKTYVIRLQERLVGLQNSNIF